MTGTSDGSMKGRTAIVTGGLRGIGWAVARGFADRGAKVSIIDRDPADAQQVTTAQNEIEAAGAALLYIQADVTSEAEVRSLVARVIDRFGAVDALVNNVGVGAPPKPIEQVSVDEWTKVVNQNILSAFLCSREVAPHMKRQRRGTIVNMSSQAGRSKSEIGNLPYACAKAGVLGFTRQLANELAPFGVRVNAVAPGLTLSERVEVRLSAMEEPQRKEFSAAVPLGRLGEPREIADAILFLSTDASSYVTGATLDVNGGRFMM
jgi:NAD(P)-dependent dehydrogenase (short-subunit alcohol dehydrogenase family)